MVIRGKRTQNVCLRAHDSVSTNFEDLLRFVEDVLFVKHVAEFRGQLVVHAVLRSTAVHENVSRVVAGLVHPLAVEHWRKQKSLGVLR